MVFVFLMNSKEGQKPGKNEEGLESAAYFCF